MCIFGLSRHVARPSRQLRKARNTDFSGEKIDLVSALTGVCDGGDVAEEGLRVLGGADEALGAAGHDRGEHDEDREPRERDQRLMDDLLG